MFEYLILILVGILWGSTNYLIELYYYDYETVNPVNKYFIQRMYSYIIRNYKPLIFFILNQLGSVLFYFCLGSISLSLTVVISNSVSFITSMLCEQIHKKKRFSGDYYLGLGLVLVGISLCFSNSKVN
jgi:drug/metabolite transporter (DMT)-like permease